MTRLARRRGLPVPLAIPPGYTYGSAALWFVGGAVVTALFSGSLARLATNAGPIEVLAMGMLVPSFTWLVQMTAACLCLSRAQRRTYINDLARICMLGSVALLPAALVNFALATPPLWVSAVNVLLSVGLMAADLFRRSRAHAIAVGWPLSWCLTIAINMSLFAWSSRGWWTHDV